MILTLLELTFLAVSTILSFLAAWLIIYIKKLNTKIKNLESEIESHKFMKNNLREYVYETTGYENIKDLAYNWRSTMYNFGEAFGSVLKRGFKGREQNQDVYSAIEYCLRTINKSGGYNRHFTVKNEDLFAYLYQDYPTIMPKLTGLNSYKISSIAINILLGLYKLDDSFEPKTAIL